MGDQSADPDRLSDAAGRVNRGEVRIADLAGGLQRLPHPRLWRHCCLPGPARGRRSSDQLRTRTDYS